MKRLFVSAAVLPLLTAVAHAEVKISTATTTPVRTSTVAAGQPDHITIEAAGSIAPTAAGAAVTVDSSNAVVNAGSITFNGVSNATGIEIRPGVFMAVTHNGTISLLEDYTATDTDNDGDIDGPFAQGSGRYGIRALAGVPVNGAITSAGVINIEGNDSAGIAVDTRLNGGLTTTGAITVVGDRSVGIRAESVSGNVAIRGSIAVQGEGSVGLQVGPIDGQLLIQNAISVTGYRTTERLADAVRAKFDADDLKQGGSAVKITGSVAKGVLLDRAPADNSATDTDEDKDGIPDAQETAASVTSFGGAPAVDVGGVTPITLGLVGTGDYGFGFVNRGVMAGNGVNDGITGTGLRLQSGVTVQGGMHNWTGATVAGTAYAAQATALQINNGATLPYLRNGGTITAAQNGGLHDARAIHDQSGTLREIDTSGLIRAVVTPGTNVTQTGRAIAIDLSANTTGATVRQRKFDTPDAPEIIGDVLFGSGADRLEINAGKLTGTMSFGAGADSLVVDGGATATGRIVDTDGRLTVDLRDGRLAVTNTETVNLTGLTVGAKGVLAVSIDPTATGPRLAVAGAATVATGAQVDLTLTGISKGQKSYEIIQAQSLTVGQAGATLGGAPWLYQASLRTDAAAGSLFADVRPKTAAELGLNRSGTQAFNAVFDALDKDDRIEAAFLTQKTQAGFDQLYDQMLPDHSGGVLMSAAAISAGVSSAVAQPMAIDEVSGNGAWAQEVVFHLRQDRTDAMGFKSQGFGFAAGYDMQGEMNALGANVSFVTADIKDRGAAAGEEISMNLFGAGLYWRFDGGPLQAALRGGVGYAFLDGDRRLETPAISIRADSKWNAWMVDAYAGASYEVSMGSLYLRPEASLSYLRLAEDGYKEKNGGTGFNLIVDKRTGDLLTGEALLALGWKFGEDVYLAPELKVGYRGKLAGGPATTTARFEGGQEFTLDPENVFKGGYVARAGFRGGSDRVVYAVNGGLTKDGGYEEYDVRAGVRFQF